MKRIAILVVLLMPAWAAGQSSNAGDAYRIAAMQVPQARDEGERSILQNVLNAPLDQSAVDLFARGAKSLELFDAASGMAFGDWGFDPADPLYGGRSLRGLGELADLVVLRARTHAAKSDFDSALKDCYRIALLSRRLSIQPSLTRQMQQNALMEKSLGMAASILPKLSPAQVERFTTLLRELQPAASPIDVTAVEQDSYFWLYGKLIENAELRQTTARATGTLNAIFGIQSQPIDVEDLARDPQLAQLVLNQTRDVFAKMVEALKESPEERSAAMEVIPKQHDFAHPLSRGAAQLVAQTYRQSERHAAMMETFFAAAGVPRTPEPATIPSR